MKSMNPHVAQLQINLKQAVAELDKHMRHGQCDEKAFELACTVALAATYLRSEIGAESVRKANPASTPEKMVLTHYDPNKPKIMYPVYAERDPFHPV